MKNLIIGKFNGCNDIYYFQDYLHKHAEIGDYAIVENKQGYDLVKIIGFATVACDFKFGHKKALFAIKSEDFKHRKQEIAELPF